MLRFACAYLFYLFDFIFELKFFALQFVESRSVRSWVGFFAGYGAVDRLMASDKFRQMRFERHLRTPYGLQRRNCDTTAGRRKRQSAHGVIKLLLFRSQIVASFFLTQRRPCA